MKSINFTYGLFDYDPDAVYLLEKEHVDFFLEYHNYRKRPAGYGGYTIGPESKKNNITYVEKDYQLLLKIIKSKRYQTYNEEPIYLKDKQLNKVISLILYSIGIIAALIAIVMLVRVGSLELLSKETKGVITSINYDYHKAGGVFVMSKANIEFQYSINEILYKNTEKVDLFFYDMEKSNIGDTIKIKYVPFFKDLSKIVKGNRH